MSSSLGIFIPLTKIDLEQRLVYGVATAEEPDRAGEICDYASTRPLYEKWSQDMASATNGKSLGALRSMHGKVAAGKIVSIAFNDAEKRIEIIAKVVDDHEWRKVEQGVYTGFSQGGSYRRRWADETDPSLTRYTAEPTEISLVDRPCLPAATFEAIKADGSSEQRSFLKTAEEMGVTQVWRTRDGATFARKADALAHIPKADGVSQQSEDAFEVLERALSLLSQERENRSASRADRAFLRKAFDQLAAMVPQEADQVDSSHEKSAPPPQSSPMEPLLSSALEKTAGLAADYARLQQDVLQLSQQVASLSAQPQPHPFLAGARALEKNQDGAPLRDGDDLQAAFARLDPSEQAHFMIRFAQKRPMGFSSRG